MTVTRQEYSRLRHAANERNRRLEKQGFGGQYRAPSLRGLTDKQVQAEYKKLERWMKKETSTVTGAKAVQARKAEQAAQRKEKAAERRREKRAGAGVKPPRPPKWTEEQKRERKREYQRQYRARKRAEKLDRDLESLKGSKEYTALKNLLSGLQKYGIVVNSLDDLSAWGRYLAEVKDDSNSDLYKFDEYLDEMMEQTGKDARSITGKDIDRVLDKFNQWKADQTSMESVFNQERQSNEYSAADMGSLWEMYINQ